jgi:hypothetical protein
MRIYKKNVALFAVVLLLVGITWIAVLTGPGKNIYGFNFFASSSLQFPFSSVAFLLFMAAGYTCIAMFHLYLHSVMIE